MTCAVVFPGQGSQSAGMAALYGAHPQVSEALAEASDAIGVDLSAMAGSGKTGEGGGGGGKNGNENASGGASGNGEQLNRTENTQPAMLAMDVGVYRAFVSVTDSRPVVMAGHSLGEYAALVCAEALDFAEAVRIARFRGEAMARATPPGTGAISAVIGLSPEVADDCCREVRDDGGKAWAANYNSPMQTVIAGDSDSVARASELLRARGAKRIAPLPMSAPSHCPLMSPAADELSERLQSVDFRAPTIPIVHNKTAAVCDSPEDIPTLLREQVVSPVRWTETIQALAKTIGTPGRILECGPGAALTGLGKRIAPDLSHIALRDSESLANIGAEL